jgi:hypothetical protein
MLRELREDVATAFRLPPAISTVLETYVARPANDVWSVSSARICFAFELVNERRGLP